MSFILWEVLCPVESGLRSERGESRLSQERAFRSLNSSKLAIFSRVEKLPKCGWSFRGIAKGSSVTHSFSCCQSSFSKLLICCSKRVSWFKKGFLEISEEGKANNFLPIGSDTYKLLSLNSSLTLKISS